MQRLCSSAATYKQPSSQGKRKSTELHVRRGPHSRNRLLAPRLPMNMSYGAICSREDGEMTEVGFCHLCKGEPMPMVAKTGGVCLVYAIGLGPGRAVATPERHKQIYDRVQGEE